MIVEVTPEQKDQIITAYDEGQKAALNSVLDMFPADVQEAFKSQLFNSGMSDAKDYFDCNYVCNE